MWSAWLTAVNRFTAFPPPPPPAALSVSADAAAPSPEKRRRPVTAAALLAASFSALVVAIGRRGPEAGAGIAQLSCRRETEVGGILGETAAAAAVPCFSTSSAVRVTWADKNPLTMRDYPRVRAITHSMSPHIFFLNTASFYHV
jgi:hypothetical protein